MPAEHQETLSDGSAGDVEPGSITFPVCRDLVDDYILVSEEEIGEAIRFMVHAHHKIVEGAAAVAVASLLKRKERIPGTHRGCRHLRRQYRRTDAGRGCWPDERVPGRLNGARVPTGRLSGAWPAERAPSG